jgi:hypothetical protein
MAAKLNLFFSFLFFIRHQINLQFAQKIKRASEHARSAFEEASFHYSLFTLYILIFVFLF